MKERERESFNGNQKSETKVSFFFFQNIEIKMKANYSKTKK